MDDWKGVRAMRMRLLLAVILMWAGIVIAQTPEEQIAVKVAEIQAICEAAALPSCFIITTSSQCPDSLATTRAGLTAARNTIDQVLTENPVP